MMFLGASSVVIPLYHAKVHKIYDYTTNKLLDLIFLVILSIIIFESWMFLQNPQTHYLLKLDREKFMTAKKTRLKTIASIF